MKDHPSLPVSFLNPTLPFGNLSVTCTTFPSAQVSLYVLRTSELLSVKTSVRDKVVAVYLYSILRVSTRYMYF